MEASAILTAQLAQTRSEVALSAIKFNADSEKQIADILQSAIASVPGSPVRGVNVNVKA